MNLFRILLAVGLIGSFGAALAFNSFQGGLYENAASVLFAQNRNNVKINAVCGNTAAAQTQEEIRSRSNLCAKGVINTQSISGRSSSFSWICRGQNGGTNAECSALKKAAAPSTSTSTRDVPADNNNSNTRMVAKCGNTAKVKDQNEVRARTNLCAQGEVVAGSITGTDASFFWRCRTASGNTSVCEAKRETPLVASSTIKATTATSSRSTAVCGNTAAAQSQQEIRSRSNLCGRGNALMAGTIITTDNAFTWKCKAASGDTATCSANRLKGDIASSTLGAAINASSTLGSTVFTRNLTVGSRGADVSALQAFLIEKGFLKLAAPTGYFGFSTASALSLWQASVGISPARGYFGPATRASMVGR